MKTNAIALMISILVCGCEPVLDHLDNESNRLRVWNESDEVVPKLVINKGSVALTSERIQPGDIEYRLLSVRSRRTIPFSLAIQYRDGTTATTNWTTTLDPRELQEIQIAIKSNRVLNVVIKNRARTSASTVRRTRVTPAAYALVVPGFPNGEP